MGAFTKVRGAFTPLAVIGAYLPIPTLVPLTLSLFGTGEMQKVMFLAHRVRSIYLLPLVVEAIDDVDDGLPEHRLHAGGQPLAGGDRVLLPIACAGHLSDAMRLTASAWAGATSCWPRWSTPSAASGGIIITSQRRGPREHIYLVLVVIMAWRS